MRKREKRTKWGTYMGGEECSTLCVCLYVRKMPAGVHDADVNVGRCVAGLCKVDWHQRETGARRCKSRATLTDLAGKMGDKEARLYTQPLFGSPPFLPFSETFLPIMQRSPKASSRLRTTGRDKVGAKVIDYHQTGVSSLQTLPTSTAHPHRRTRRDPARVRSSQAITQRRYQVY